MLPIILLPGMDGTGTLFSALTPELKGKSDAQVVSYSTSQAVGYEGLQTWVRARLPESGPVVLLGESFSGPIAIALAAALPERIAGLVLCCTFAKNPRPALARLGAILNKLPLGRPPLTLLAHVLLGRFSSPELRTLLFNAVGSVSPAVMRARLGAVLSVDVTALAATIRAPILYLQASEDRVVPPSAAGDLRRVCQSIQIQVIEGPHCLLQVAPAVAGAAIRKFIAGLAASAAS